MSLFLTAALSIAPVAVKIVPEPSSLIVAVPVTAVPPVGVAVRVKVSPLSGVVSLVMGVRTSSPVVSTTASQVIIKDAGISDPSSATIERVLHASASHSLYHYR
jgi:hypothetical protein